MDNTSLDQDEIVRLNAQALMKRARSPANKAIRREAILDAAEQHLTVVGIDGFALNPIAQALSIAKGTIYLYFETRESLLLALIGRKVQRWFDAVTIGLKQVSTGRDWAALIFDTAHEDSDLIKLLLRQDLIIEHNLPQARLIEYKTWWRQWFETLAMLLAEQLEWRESAGLEAVRVTGPMLLGFCLAEQGPDLEAADCPPALLQFFSEMSPRDAFVTNLSRLMQAIEREGKK